MNPQLLKRCVLFAGLEDTDLQAIAQVATLRKYAAGESILEEGEQAEAFYAVADGSVRVYKASPAGKQQVLRFVRPGEVFGEAAAFALDSYPASAEAVTPTGLIRVNAAGFRRLFAESPDLSLNVIMTLFRRLQELVSIVEELSLQNVAARVAKYLLDLWRQPQSEGRRADVVMLDIKKGDLAIRLGTVNETLSRTFAKLRAQGIVDVQGRRVHILNHEALEMVASGMEDPGN